MKQVTIMRVTAVLCFSVIATTPSWVTAEGTASDAAAALTAPSSPERTFDAVAKVASVGSRDSRGRIARFRDSGNREFQITYDAHSRVKAATATLRPHISDVADIGYDAQGRLIGVRLGAGDMLHVNYLDDGTQVIRDRYGGLVARQGSLVRGYQVLQISDPAGRLVATVEGLDALMRIAAQ